MREYLTALLGASLLCAMISILSPKGEKDGLAKHMRLLSALFLIGVLLSPLKNAAEGIGGLINGSVEIPLPDGGEDSYREEMQEAMDGASTAYFTDMLTQLLEEQFDITPGELRCMTAWESDGEGLRPKQITVVLSGKAIWKDPEAIERFVSELLGCPCKSAIE